MRRPRISVLIVLCALAGSALGACSSGDRSDFLEGDLPKFIKNEGAGTLTSVRCKKKKGEIYTCRGTYDPPGGPSGSVTQARDAEYEVIMKGKKEYSYIEK